MMNVGQDIPKRVAVACSNCRDRKIKCITETKEQACMRCHFNGMNCSYVATEKQKERAEAKAKAATGATRRKRNATATRPAPYPVSDPRSASPNATSRPTEPPLEIVLQHVSQIDDGVVAHRASPVPTAETELLLSETLSPYPAAAYLPSPPIMSAPMPPALGLDLSFPTGMASPCTVTPASSLASAYPYLPTSSPVYSYASSASPATSCAGSPAAQYVQVLPAYAYPTPPPSSGASSFPAMPTPSGYYPGPQPQPQRTVSLSGYAQQQQRVAGPGYNELDAYDLAVALHTYPRLSRGRDRGRGRGCSFTSAGTSPSPAPQLSPLTSCVYPEPLSTSPAVYAAF
ncbi:Zn(2)-C6 fungal-type domain-containing protein [Mycena kentingensis (nom. inval.)]|nr:Zn(2)-C6 fungal-type domain-containing protein [Mycena kentingensis (nom. inval.)]